MTALIGPSGCGKSTFLRILNRMHELVPGAALAGSVYLDGDDIYGAGQRPIEVRKRIGMVFQKPNPFPAMSIYQNVISGLSLTGKRVRKNDALVEECLTRAGLWNEVKNRLGNPGGALSGGQQQRLCIARALAVRARGAADGRALLGARPDLDAADRGDRARARLEVTVVIVTHNMQQAQRVSTRCAFFLAAENEPGHIVEAGTTAQIFEQPARPADRRLRARAVRLMRLARIAVAAVLLAAALLLRPARGAQASGPTITGAGSTWVQIALDQWRADAARQGLSINYQGVGSTAGRQFYIIGQVDFAASEIPFLPDEVAQLRSSTSRTSTCRTSPAARPSCTT